MIYMLLASFFQCASQEGEEKGEWERQREGRKTEEERGGRERERERGGWGRERAVLPAGILSIEKEQHPGLVPRLFTL